jgi:four helix bundle protein
MARFTQIAMGSGAELSYHLVLARDLGLIEPAQYEALNFELNGVMPMLSSFAGKLRSARAA